MAIAGLDPVIHAPLRLEICAILSATDEAEFARVREETGVSESVLSKHVRQLEEAGYVVVRKAVSASRRRTWLSLTASGQSAFRAHFAALAALLSRTLERGAAGRGGDGGSGAA
jgi:DNA-binding MarR family transcriptional regulator